MKFEDVQSVLTSAFLPEVIPLLPDWLDRSSVPARKGIKVLAAVMRHRGMKRFRPQHRRQTSSSEMTTSYTSDFHWASPVPPLSELFKYRQLRDLDYSAVLTPLCLTVLQRWLDLKDEERFVEVLMELLRSVYTCYKGAFTQNLTTMKMSYHVYSQADLLRASQHYKATAQVHRGVQPQRRPQPVSLPVTRVPSPITLVSTSKPKPTQWLNSGVHSKFVSSYMDNFKPHFLKFKQLKRPELHTSMSITLIPRVDI